MFHYHPSNPFRLPDWRWELARTIREKKSRAIAKRSDELVHEAAKFQRKLLKCVSDTDRWFLMDEFPDHYAAYLIHKTGGDEERHPMRFAIEARLLAGQPAYEIAQLMGLTTKTVDLYERLFFNVRDRLHHSDFIMTCVIGPSVHAGLSDRDYDLLWKLFGYLYGPVVLDAFINTTSRKYRPESLSEVDVALAEDARASLQRKVAVVARTFVVNPFSQSELLNVYARFVELEKDAGDGKGRDTILQNIQIMMDKLPWRAGNDGKAVPPQLAAYDESGVELRTDELLAVSVGKALPPDASADGLKFPEVVDGKPVK